LEAANQGGGSVLGDGNSVCEFMQSGLTDADFEKIQNSMVVDKNQLTIDLMGQLFGADSWFYCKHKRKCEWPCFSYVPDVFVHACFWVKVEKILLGKNVSTLEKWRIPVVTLEVDGDKEEPWTAAETQAKTIIEACKGLAFSGKCVAVVVGKIHVKIYYLYKDIEKKQIKVWKKEFDLTKDLANQMIEVVKLLAELIYDVGVVGFEGMKMAATSLASRGFEIVIKQGSKVNKPNVCLDSCFVMQNVEWLGNGIINMQVAAGSGVEM
jgi:hypothetical protein